MYLQSSMRGAAASLAHPTALLRQRQREVRARGILDSYRREKGITVDNLPAAAPVLTPPTPTPQPEAAHPAASLLDLELDDEVHFTEEDTPCPVDCVLEVFTSQELQDILDSVSPTTLVVVDFYKTACGACKYILPGFVRLCKKSHQVWSSEDSEGESEGSQDHEVDLSGIPSSSSSSNEGEGGSSSHEAPVVFVKHNVYDDEEEALTDLARKFVIKSVPMFKFFKAGQEVDGFATRDKKRLVAAIEKHAGEGVLG